MEYSPLLPELLTLLREAVGEKALVLAPDKLAEYGKDAGSAASIPEVVIEAVNESQVQAVMRLADRFCIPVTPRGLGTGLAGGAVPLCGGIVLSLARMNKILIEPENLLAIVEPGVITSELKKAARAHGLFYPPDPASLDTCSIGGNAATNAGGPSCVKYGTTRDYVLGVDAVLPNGEKISAGVLTRKGVVGYDLARLLIGSEGTLGIITRLYLKLLPHPPAVMTLVALFADLSAAMHAVHSVLTAGYLPCAMEFLDRHCLELIGDLIPFEGADESGSFLLIEVDGAPELISREIEAIGEICVEAGAVNAVFAPDSQKRSHMWEIRRQVSLRIEESYPVYIPEDIVVPLNRIAQFVEGLPELEKEYQVKIYSFGHAGDGNIHLNMTAGKQNNPETTERGIEAVLARVISMGGTISGEHGIGAAKKRYMRMELSAESLRIQKEIKRLFDPRLILNPGKLFD